MKSLGTLSAALTALVLAAFVWLGQNEEIENTGLTRSQFPATDIQPPTKTVLAEVGRAVSTRVPELEQAAASEGTPQDHQDPVDQLVPLDLQIINQTTGKPAPLVDLRLLDQEGRSMSGFTDRLGRLRGPAALAAGFIQVKAVIAPYRPQMGGRLLEKAYAFGDFVLKPAESHATAESNARCVLDVPRRVPIRLMREKAGGSPTKVLPIQMKFYGVDSSDTTSQVLKSGLMTKLLPGLPSNFYDTTHVLTLKGVPEPNAAELAWDPAQAEALNVQRELAVYAVIKGHLYAARIMTPHLQDLGDAPLEVVLAPMDVDAIQLPAAQRAYRYLYSSSKEKARIEEAQKDRRTHGVTVVVRSASSAFEGRVSVRATPTAAAQFAHSGTSPLPLRKQWVDAPLARANGGLPEAVVTLDDLDAAEYDIRVVPLDGEPNSILPVTIILPQDGDEPIEILLPGR